MSHPIRYSRRSVWIAGTLAAFVLTAGVATPHAVRADDAIITIDNFTFTPAQITVAPGTKVTWINNDDIPHMIVDATNPQVMKSLPLDTNDRFSFTYAKAGAYPYFCGLHPHMQGTVIVQ
jgi:plastocyanin